MKKQSNTKTSKHKPTGVKRPSPALKQAAKIIGSLGGRPRNEA